MVWSRQSVGFFPCQGFLLACSMFSSSCLYSYADSICLSYIISSLKSICPQSQIPVNKRSVQILQHHFRKIVALGHTNLANLKLKYIYFNFHPQLLSIIEKHLIMTMWVLNFFFVQKILRCNVYNIQNNVESAYVLKTLGQCLILLCTTYKI